jgi:hypothetical protein
MGNTLENTFRAPKGITTFRTVTVRELDGIAEKDAAAWADRRIAKEEVANDDVFKRLKIEREEEIRASIVAVDDVPVCKPGVPWKGFDAWPKRAKLAVAQFHDAMNGLDAQDLKKCIAEVMDPNPSRDDEEGAATDEPNGG